MATVVRLTEAVKYDAPMHDPTVYSMYLQHRSLGCKAPFWVGLSYYLPGARAHMSASAIERVYVLLDGQLTLEVEGTTTVLQPLDSVYIGPNERREVRNETKRVATLLVIMPYPPEG